jgi:glutaredoxin
LKVTFLSRPGCHLCDEALAGLKRFVAREGRDLEVEIVNIETDDELHRRYLEKIPVILLEGETVSEFAFDPDELIAAIEGHEQGSG